MQMGTGKMAPSVKCLCKPEALIVSLHPGKKLGLMVHICNPSWEGRGSGIPWGLMADLLTLISEPGVPVRESDSKRDKMSETNLAVSWRRALDVDLCHQQLRASAHTFTHMHTYTHIHMYKYTTPTWSHMHTQTEIKKQRSAYT